MFKNAFSLLVFCALSSVLHAAVPFEGQWLNNPFEPAGAVMDSSRDSSQSVQLKLGGILVSKKRKQATINGQFVREGDVFLGVRVERIERERVILSRGNERIELNRPSDSGLLKR